MKFIQKLKNDLASKGYCYFCRKKKYCGHQCKAKRDIHRFNDAEVKKK